MRVTAYFSQPNYARHGMPIVDELRARDVDVECWARDTGAAWGPPFVDLFRDQIAPTVLVASHQDARYWQDRQVIYVEHGAGQTYEVDDPALGAGFGGGPGLDHVVLFVCPSERVAARWRARYPQARVAVVGCPALDRYAATARSGTAPVSLERSLASKCRSEPRSVAITAHHPTFGDIPECRPALPHYDAALPHLRIDLARAGIELVGHAHPRGRGAMERRWENLGVRYEPDPDVILSTASLLVVDNSSLAYEAAAVDLPVLTLNAPWYRRNVEHGLRFWSHVPGLMCDDPRDLAAQVHHALADYPTASALRARAALYAYDALDGRAATRAADAILTLEGAPPMAPTSGSETSAHLDEVIDRLAQLGADEDMIASVRTLPDEEVEGLRRSNDQILSARIAESRAHAVGEPDSELDDAAREALDNAEDDDAVLALVGDDPDLAARMFRLESDSPDPSAELLAALAAIAGIDYTAPDAPEPAEVVEVAEPLQPGDEAEITEA